MYFNRVELEVRDLSAAPAAHYRNASIALKPFRKEAFNYACISPTWWLWSDGKQVTGGRSQAFMEALVHVDVQDKSLSFTCYDSNFSFLKKEHWI